MRMTNVPEKEEEPSVPYDATEDQILDFWDRIDNLY